MKPESMIGEKEAARAIRLTTISDDGPEPAVRYARAAISAHLAALERAGWKCVPVEPTEAMLIEGWNNSPASVPAADLDNMNIAEMWDAMIAAAPPLQNSDEVKPSSNTKGTGEA